GARPVTRRCQLRAAHRLPAPAVHRPRRATAVRRARRRLDDARRRVHLRRQLLERPRGDAGGRAPALRRDELDPPLTAITRVLKARRMLKKVQMRGGARRQPARRTGDGRAAAAGEASGYGSPGEREDGRAAAAGEASGYGSPGERERAPLSWLPRAPYLRRWA